MHDTIDDEAGPVIPWFSMPDRSDDAAVLAWLDAAEKAEADTSGQLDAELDACIDLFAELRALVRRRE